MALADIHVKKPREAQIWNCCTGNPVLRILPDSNNLEKIKLKIKSSSEKFRRLQYDSLFVLRQHVKKWYFCNVLFRLGVGTLLLCPFFVVSTFSKKINHK